MNSLPKNQKQTKNLLVKKVVVKYFDIVMEYRSFLVISHDTMSPCICKNFINIFIYLLTIQYVNFPVILQQRINLFLIRFIYLNNCTFKINN